MACYPVLHGLRPSQYGSTSMRHYLVTRDLCLHHCTNLSSYLRIMCQWTDPMLGTVCMTRWPIFHPKQVCQIGGHRSGLDERYKRTGATLEHFATGLIRLLLLPSHNRFFRTRIAISMSLDLHQSNFARARDMDAWWEIFTCFTRWSADSDEQVRMHSGGPSLSQDRCSLLQSCCKEKRRPSS